MFNPLLAAGLVLCSAVPVIAVAQSASTESLSAVRTQGTKPLGYRSAFEGYKPYSDETTGDWKALNATTAKVGGWRVYAKEARQAQTSDVAVESSSSVQPTVPSKP